MDSAPKLLESIEHRIEEWYGAAGLAIIGLGGAYLLRALTESNTLSPPIGLAAGFTYAIIWLLVSDRAARDRQWFRATCLSALTPIIAFSLVTEATLRFAIVTAPLAFLALTAITLLSLAASYHRDLRTAAWVTTLLGTGSALALMVQTSQVSSALGYLGIAGTSTLWIGSIRGWGLLPWPVATIADFVAIGLISRVMRPDTGENPAFALAALVFLALGYGGSTVIRTIALHRTVSAIELWQMPVSFALAVGGTLAAAFVLGTTGLSVAAGVVTVGLGLAAYVVCSVGSATTFNARFYGAFALLLMLAGGVILLPRDWLAWSWMALAILVTAIATRTGSQLLGMHGVAYAIASAAPSQLAANTLAALFGRIESAPTLSAVSVASAVVLAATFVISVDRSSWMNPLRLTRWVAAAALLLAAAGCATTLLLGVLPAAVARTVSVSLLVLVIAVVGRSHRIPEFEIFITPVLFFTGAKLLLDDFRHSTPAMLFVSLAAYGTTLMLVSRMRRSHRIPASDSGDLPSGEAETETPRGSG